MPAHVPSLVIAGEEVRDNRDGERCRKLLVDRVTMLAKLGLGAVRFLEPRFDLRPYS